MYSRSLLANLHIIGLVTLVCGACTYELPTVAPTGGFAGSGNSGGAGGVGGASPCLGNQMLCNDICTNTSADPLHCGDCMTKCNTGFSCEAGMCQMAMPCTPDAMKDCYSGPQGTEGVGSCKSGTQKCAADGSSWGPCMGEVHPATETCGNIVDEDCNGILLTGSACLVDTNVVVRYFLDEAVSGQGVMAMDSAPNPLDLPVMYDSTNKQPSYTAAGSGRGLEWNVTDLGGVASALVNGTKVQTMLETKTKGTIELVARVDGATVNHTRLFTITINTYNVFSLGVFSSPAYSALHNDIEVGRWPADFGNLGRAVYHLVMDSTEANSSDRVRLYINGERQTASGGAELPLQTPFSFAGTESICLGNRDTQGRSIDGALYYAALYADALSEADIATNTKILQAWDDK